MSPGTLGHWSRTTGDPWPLSVPAGVKVCLKPLGSAPPRVSGTQAPAFPLQQRDPVPAGADRLDHRQEATSPRLSDGDLEERGADPLTPLTLADEQPGDGDELRVRAAGHLAPSHRTGDVQPYVADRDVPENLPVPLRDPCVEHVLVG